MSRRSIILIALLIVSPVVIYFLWPSDEARIRKLFREGAKAVEAEKVEDVMAKVSFNYADDQGLTYLILRDGLTRAFRQMSHIKMEYEVKDIRVDEEKAAAELDVRVIATSRNDTGYIVGDAGKPAHLRFGLEKERGKWLVARAEGMKTLPWSQ